MKNANIVYFLTRSLFLGFGISLLFYQSGKDCYWGAIVGLLIGVIITYFYNYIIREKKKQDLDKLYQKDKVWGLVARILMGVVSYIILIYVLVLYVSFTISFLLVTTPEFYVLIPFLILAGYCAFKGLKIISRVATFMMVFSIIMVILAVLGLSVFFEATNFLPILTNTPSSFLMNVITFAGVSSLPNVLTLHFNNEGEGNLANYVVGAITIILMVVCINGALGENLVKIFRFPEYIVLKQLKIFKFIEKVENIFSLVWVMDIYITATMAIFSLKKTLPIKYNKAILWGILIGSIYIVDMIFGFNYVNELRLYYILPFLAFFMAIGMIFPFMYLVKKKTKS